MSQEYLDKLTNEDNNLLKDALVKICQCLEKYNDIERNELEVEFRFGYLTNDAFNSEVSEIFYKKILGHLTDSNLKQISKETLDSFSGGIRKSKDISKNRSTFMKKEKLATLDFSLTNTPFDIRVSISREIKMSSKDFSEKSISFQRNKDRLSFLHKAWSYDLTRIKYDDNGLSKEIFEVELEVSISHKDLNYLIHSSLLKVKDLALFCENENEEKQFLLINEKIHH